MPLPSAGSGEGRKGRGGERDPAGERAADHRISAGTATATGSVRRLAATRRIPLAVATPPLPPRAITTAVTAYAIGTWGGEERTGKMKRGGKKKR
uniref:Uncharacterized protein n=1 Tax=Oryza sativa subsp. japonica TaxID=39947 RepID=Q8W2U6_ORYSJ|nr:hypothetical protein [Oryza sativa Japonica Group]